MYEICICLLDGTGATVTGDRECSVSSYSRTGFVRTPRDGFGWAGYCRPHSATQELGSMYEICILDSIGDTNGDTVARDRECCQRSSYSRAGVVRTPRDGFGWAGYCRPHSATQEIGGMYEFFTSRSNADTSAGTVAGDRDCCQGPSCSRTGLVGTPRDGFGWAGYCC